MAETSLESLTEGKASGPYVMENVGFDEGKTGGPDLPPDTLQPDPPKQSIEDMTKPPQALVDLQRQRTGDVEEERQIQYGIIDLDQAELHRRFAQTGIEPGTLEPWDNNKQREKYRTDPIESFGSLGSVFAMVASAFTRAPMENALNGAAAAMNAIKAGNEQEFQLAHRAWKENTDLALKRHDIMQRQYENAIQLMSSDVAAGRAKMTMLAASYDDQQMLGLMNAGLWPQGLELMEKRNKVAKDQIEIRDRMDQSSFQRQSLKVSLENNKQIEDPAKRALQNLVEFNRIYGIKEQTPQQAIFATYMVQHPNATVEEISDFARKNGLLPYANRQGRETPAQLQAEEIKRRATQYMVPREEGGEGLSPNEAFDRASKEVTTDFAKPGAGGNAAAARRMELANETIQNFEQVAGAPLSAVERGMVQQAFEDKTSQAAFKLSALEAAMEEIQKRKAAGELITAEERTKVLQSHLERGERTRIAQENLRLKQERSDRQKEQLETGHLDDAAIDRMAQQYVEAGDTSVKTNVGAGASRGENLARLNQKIADIQIRDNVSPKEQAARIAKNIGEKQFQRTAGGYAARVEVATNEVAQIAPLALGASDKMASRSKYVPVNTAIQMWQRGSSNLELVEFATNNFALKNAYVRAMNPTGVPRVQERAEAHADGLFRTATSADAYRVMVQQMIREVQASKRAVQATRDENTLDAEMLKILNQKTPTGRSSGGSAGSPLGGPSKSLPTVKTKAEYDKLEKGTKFIGEDGNEWTKP